MRDEMTYEEARKWYYYALDTYNVIDTMVKRELNKIFEGKILVLFIDCYDLIPYLFPKNMVSFEEHYDWSRHLWGNVFDSIRSTDNLKICVSPPSSLELLNFLDKKALYVYKGAPVIKFTDFSDNKTFVNKLLAVQHALAATETLLDQRTKRVPQLMKLKELIHERKVVNATNVFNYSSSYWEGYDKIVTGKFEIGGAEQFLRNNREDYRKDNFSINVDLSNIGQTIYANELSTDKYFTFASHSIFTLLCCHRNSRFWKEKTQDPPVLNSLLALFLARALREHLSYDEASDFYLGAKFAFKNYLKEFIKLFGLDSDLESYIYQPETHRHMSTRKIGKPVSIKKTEEYIQNYCQSCFPGLKSPTTDITVSATRLSTVDKKEIIAFSRNKKHRKKVGEELLKASVDSVRETILNIDKIATNYLPHDETAALLIKKLHYYSFDDLEKDDQGQDATYTNEYVKCVQH